MNEISLRSLIEFIVVKLPRMFVDMVNIIFTPISDVLGVGATSIIRWLNSLVGLGNPLWNSINQSIIEPMLNFGLIGLFSTTTLFIIIILKVVDLVIPI